MVVGISSGSQIKEVIKIARKKKTIIVVYKDGSKEEFKTIGISKLPTKVKKNAKKFIVM